MHGNEEFPSGLYVQVAEIVGLPGDMTRDETGLYEGDPRSQKQDPTACWGLRVASSKRVGTSRSAFVGGGTVHAWDRSAEHPKVTAQLGAVMDEVTQHPSAED
jgi:hypothetical protein